MSDWLLNLPVLWMAVVVFAATYLLAASIYWNRITLPERSILQRISRLVVPTVIALHHFAMEAEVDRPLPHGGTMRVTGWRRSPPPRSKAPLGS